ncbi:MAG: MFS transporter [Clostridia bacterium]
MELLPNKPLWTRDFTIITLGTVVSMLGNAVAGFAIGLLVLDYTDSVFLYAFFMVCYSLPRVVMPLLAGPFLDRFSRRKVIYTLDFLSSGLYVLIFLLLRRQWFNYPVFILVAMFVGAIDSVYAVAYESFYPTLISRGNFTRAYSIASLIQPLATTIMVPIAGVCYQSIGLAPLFVFNAVTFFIAALAETRITSGEAHEQIREKEKFNRKRFLTDFKDGIAYLNREQGLATITWYFFVSTLTYAVVSTLTLPYFKSHAVFNVTHYTIIMAVSTVGRLIGGTIHYRYRFPAGKKFAIAIFVYVILSVMEGTYLFLPLIGMLCVQLVEGILSVTSYNIRLSGTQNYVQDIMRGRFNGIFQMLNILGAIGGQLIAGVLGEFLPVRSVIVCAMALNIVGVFVVLMPHKDAVRRIYNVNV